MSAHRHEGRVGARGDVVEASDAAYSERTFVAPSKAGITLPSEAFAGRGCITKAEWERRHNLTYPTHEEAPAPLPRPGA